MAKGRPQRGDRQREAQAGSDRTLGRRLARFFARALLAAAALALAGTEVSSSPAGGGAEKRPAMDKTKPLDRSNLWERTGRNLLSGFRNMYQPCVVEESDSLYRYKMWFFGWSATDTNAHLSIPGCDMIFHARSKDLERWEVWCGDGQWDATGLEIAKWRPILAPEGKFYDAWHDGDPSVVRKDRRYYMAYSATSKPFSKSVAGYPSDMVQCVMGAVSEDGIHWERSPQPLLIAAGDAIAARPDPNRIGDFHRPCLRWEQDRWRLWFDYWIPGKGVCMGHAVNTGDFSAKGGFVVSHPPAEPLLTGWPNPDVVKVGRWYYCFSDPGIYPGATGWAARQIAEARSADGLRWEVLGYVAPDSDTPACHVPQACVLIVEGREWLYVFYSCQVGGDPYDWRYNRIRCMRRPLEE